MRKDLQTSVIAIVLLTLALGLAYPLLLMGTSQAVFGAKADGDRRLTAIKTKDPADFQPRPSATGYSTTATFFANLGPNSKAARAFYRGAIRRYLARNAQYNPGLTAARIPIDAVTHSASGVDPHISTANAAIQARRVAAVRHVGLAQVMRLVHASTDGRFLGLFGEPGVNVTTLNEALNR
ncbi:MAG: potassium-transporting ATPase KdpC subunit [Solirubrobacteraceae bacterium]|jgi:K+-transporting ATPase ATPase C chain|nr:potassium-transporting ATPase KdpC subunit [Solirubrobacteraceae bacterium]